MKKVFFYIIVLLIMLESLGLETQAIKGEKIDREIAEHYKLMEYTGGKPVKTSDVVSNKVDPVSPQRLMEYFRENGK